MPLERRDGPDGAYLVRPQFRADDYRVDPNSLRAIENWRGDLSIDMLLEERDGPFVGWEEVGRFERAGKKWVRLRHLTGEYCVDAEVMRAGLGEIVPVAPEVSYQLAIEHDRQRKDLIVHE